MAVAQHFKARRLAHKIGDVLAGCGIVLGVVATSAVVLSLIFGGYTHRPVVATIAALWIASFITGISGGIALCITGIWLKRDISAIKRLDNSYRSSLHVAADKDCSIILSIASHAGTIKDGICGTPPHRFLRREIGRGGAYSDAFAWSMRQIEAYPGLWWLYVSAALSQKADFQGRGIKKSRAGSKYTAHCPLAIENFVEFWGGGDWSKDIEDPIGFIKLKEKRPAGYKHDRAMDWLADSVVGDFMLILKGHHQPQVLSDAEPSAAAHGDGRGSPVTRAFTYPSALA